MPLAENRIDPYIYGENARHSHRIFYCVSSNKVLGYPLSIFNGVSGSGSYIDGYLAFSSLNKTDNDLIA